MNDPTSGDGRQRRDPFAVDEGRALDALRLSWGGVYDVGRGEGQWTARRKDGRGGALTGDTPDALTQAMRADSGTL